MQCSNDLIECKINSGYQFISLYVITTTAAEEKLQAFISIQRNINCSYVVICLLMYSAKPKIHQESISVGL